MDYESLDPRVVSLHQITGSITMAVLAVGAFLAIAVSAIVEGMPVAAIAVLLGAWTIMVVLGLWLALTWPARAYRHTSFRVDEQGIEIRRGVFWRDVVSVPRSRVQHIDVSQGPLERRYGLGTLVIYTAGTDHARVALDGLEHGRAMQLRALLLPTTQGPTGSDAGVLSGADDAV